VIVNGNDSREDVEALHLTLNVEIAFTFPFSSASLHAENLRLSEFQKTVVFMAVRIWQSPHQSVSADPPAL